MISFLAFVISLITCSSIASFPSYSRSHYLFCLTGSVLPLLSYCMHLQPLFSNSLACHEHVTKVFGKWGIVNAQAELRWVAIGPVSTLSSRILGSQYNRRQSGPKSQKKADHSLLQLITCICVQRSSCVHTKAKWCNFKKKRRYILDDVLFYLMVFCCIFASHSAHYKWLY